MKKGSKRFLAALTAVVVLGLLWAIQGCPLAYADSPETGRPVNSVTGHGIWDIFITGAQEDDAQYDAQYIDQISINAWLDESGTAHGTIVWTSVYHIVPADPEGEWPPGPGSSGYPWYMDVTDLVVSGNVATITADLVSSPQVPEDVEDPDNKGVLFTVTDNDNGAQDPDNPDTIAVAYPSQPSGWEGPVLAGNLKVR